VAQRLADEHRSLVEAAGVWAIVAGELVRWSHDSGQLHRELVWFGEEPMLEAQARRYCKRRGRIYASMSEARFVLFGHDV
jgi:hypothetical protein